MNPPFPSQQQLLWVDRIGRWTLSLVFLLAAVPKLVNPRDFAAIIEAYGILPHFLNFPVALLLSLVEVILAVGVFYNRLTCKIGLMLLLLIFIGVLSYAIGQGLDIDCGCFGAADPEFRAFKGVRVALVRDLVMILPLVYSIWYHRYRTISPGHLEEKPLHSLSQGK